MQIIEPELAENATMGPEMTKFRALMQEQYCGSQAMFSQNTR